MSARSKVALITGITGQDGSYLAEFLLKKGYEVHGIKRRASTFNQTRIEHLFARTAGPLGYRPVVHDTTMADSIRDGEEISDTAAHSPQLKEESATSVSSENESNLPIFLHYGDLADMNNLVRILLTVRPAEIYNLAAQSHVRVSFDMPIYTCQVDALGVVNLLEAIRCCGLARSTRFYQASTSEMFGNVQAQFQDEKTSFHPRSPYGFAKVMAHWAVVNYREAYGMFCCNGILFNHESPRRGPTFVTRKITRAVAAIVLGRQECLFLGNLDAKRDWGHARDYVECMWKMLQQDRPEDFVVATGETHSVREFCERAFAEVGMRLLWQGQGVNEVGICESSGKVVVRIDPRYFRPSEVEYLRGNPDKAKRVLGWEPAKTSFQALVREMVEQDLLLARRDAAVADSVMKHIADMPGSERL